MKEQHGNEQTINRLYQCAAWQRATKISTLSTNNMATSKQQIDLFISDMAMSKESMSNVAMGNQSIDFIDEQQGNKYIINRSTYPSATWQRTKNQSAAC